MRSRLVAGLEVFLGVDPADDRATGATGGKPERVAGVLGEDQMMRREAGVNIRNLIRLGIVHRDLPRRGLHWEQFCRGVIRSLAAEHRRLRRPDSCGQPHPTVLIEHWIVHRGLAFPDHLIAPIGRRQPREVSGRDEYAGRRLWIARLHPEVIHRIGFRIEDRQVVG